jgi:hypothetical protein
MSPRVTLFFVICGQIPLAEKALAALLSSNQIAQARIVVVLNGLQESEKEGFKSDSYRIVEFESRESHARVLNTLLRDVQTEFFAIVHEDVIVSKQWLSSMLTVFDLEKQTAYEQSISVQEDLLELVAASPWTNHAASRGLVYERFEKKIQALKPPTKTPLTNEIIEVLLKEAYGELGLEGCAIQITRRQETWYTFVSQVESYCVVFKTKAFKRVCNQFSEIFSGAGGEMRYACRQLDRAGYVFARINIAYVHHWGNLTTDGVGFNYLEQLNHQQALLEKTETE